MPRTTLAPRPAGLLVAVAAGVLVAAAPAAAAQDTELVLTGPAGHALRDAGVRVAAVPPAATTRTRVTLPVDEATIAGTTATVTQRGGLRLSAGGRTLELGHLRVIVGARSRLTARASGGARLSLPIAAPANRRTVAADGTSITEAPIRLTAAAARLLGQRLHRPSIAAGRLGTIDLDADATSTTTIPGAPPAPTVTGPPTPGGATVAARPAGAVSITGGTARWSPRASWLGYLAQGEGAGGTAGASFDGTGFTLAIRDGWFDAASGQAVVNTTGATRFQYSGHGIDLLLADWTYALAGATPKAVALVERAGAHTTGTVIKAGTRQPLALIKTAGVTPTVAGATATWTDLPLTLSAEGVSLYLAYLYDSDQGRLTISANLG